MSHYQNPASDTQYQAWLADTSRFPFSFTYGGTIYNGFSPDAQIDEQQTHMGARETTVRRYKVDAALTVTLKLTHSYDYGVTEWTVYFQKHRKRKQRAVDRGEKLPALHKKPARSVDRAGFLIAFGLSNMRKGSLFTLLGQHTQPELQLVGGLLMHHPSRVPAQEVGKRMLVCILLPLVDLAGGHAVTKHFL